MSAGQGAGAGASCSWKTADLHSRKLCLHPRDHHYEENVGSRASCQHRHGRVGAIEGPRSLTAARCPPECSRLRMMLSFIFGARAGHSDSTWAPLSWGAPGVEWRTLRARLGSVPGRGSGPLVRAREPQHWLLKGATRAPSFSGVCSVFSDSEFLHPIRQQPRNSELLPHL